MEYVQTYASTGSTIASELLKIEAIKLNHEKPFTWASGWKSPIYCDNRLSLSYPALRTAIRDGLSEVVKRYFPDVECIAGVATAGVAQGALVAEQLNLPYVYVRPKPKDHGMGNLIEGKVRKGQKAVLIEDLVSTGGSSLKAAEAMKDAGFEVLGMAAIFTYGFDVARANFEKAKIPLVCLSDFTFLLTEAVNQKYLTEEQLVYVKSWRLDPAHWK